MTTLEDLLVQSNQSSPIQPLTSTTLPDYSTDPNDGYQWDTQPAEYSFGRQRKDQDIRTAETLGSEQFLTAAGPAAVQRLVNSAGPTPVSQAVWRKDVRSSGGVGGQVFRDYSDETFKYNQERVIADEERNRQAWMLGKRQIRDQQRSSEQFAEARWANMEDFAQQQQGLLEKRLGLERQSIEEREPYRHPVADLF